jgi:hypothetical protein
MRIATAARLVLGTAALFDPNRVLALVGSPDRDERPVRLVARVLGARWLVQALLDVRAGSRMRALDVTVELTHGVSMLPVAAVWPTHRRSALVSASLAAGMAVLDLAQRTDIPGERAARRT